MAPLKIALVGVLGIGIAASLAFADHKPNHPGGGGAITGVWVFAGYTTTLVTGDATLPVMYDMCQIDFANDNARMALVEELVKSPNFLLPIAAPAWVQDPAPVTISFQSHANNCFGWTETGVANGPVVRPQGDFNHEACVTPRAVACVVPQ